MEIDNLIRIEIDNEANMTYIQLNDNEVDDAVGYGSVVVDLDHEGNACGVEIFGSRVNILELGDEKCT